MSRQISFTVFAVMFMSTMMLAKSLIVTEEDAAVLDGILRKANEGDYKKEAENLQDAKNQLAEILITEATQPKDGDMLQREAARRQVGDRRLKCIKYDRVKRKCLRHKLSFLWG